MNKNTFMGTKPIKDSIMHEEYSLFPRELIRIWTKTKSGSKEFFKVITGFNVIYCKVKGEENKYLQNELREIMRTMAQGVIIDGARIELVDYIHLFGKNKDKKINAYFVAVEAENKDDASYYSRILASQLEGVFKKELFGETRRFNSGDDWVFEMLYPEEIDESTLKYAEFAGSMPTIVPENTIKKANNNYGKESSMYTNAFQHLCLALDEEKTPYLIRNHLRVIPRDALKVICENCFRELEAAIANAVNSYYSNSTIGTPIPITTGMENKIIDTIENKETFIKETIGGTDQIQTLDNQLVNGFKKEGIEQETNGLKEYFSDKKGSISTENQYDGILDKIKGGLGINGIGINGLGINIQGLLNGGFEAQNYKVTEIGTKDYNDLNSGMEDYYNKQDIRNIVNTEGRTSLIRDIISDFNRKAETNVTQNGKETEDVIDRKAGITNYVNLGGGTGYSIVMPNQQAALNAEILQFKKEEILYAINTNSGFFQQTTIIVQEEDKFAERDTLQVIKGKIMSGYKRGISPIEESPIEEKDKEGLRNALISFSLHLKKEKVNFLGEGSNYSFSNENGVGLFYSPPGMDYGTVPPILPAEFFTKTITGEKDGGGNPIPMGVIVSPETNIPTDTGINILSPKNFIVGGGVGNGKTILTLHILKSLLTKYPNMNTIIFNFKEGDDSYSKLRYVLPRNVEIKKWSVGDNFAINIFNIPYGENVEKWIDPLGANFAKMYGLGVVQWSKMTTTMQYIYDSYGIYTIDDEATIEAKRRATYNKMVFLYKNSNIKAFIHDNKVVVTAITYGVEDDENKYLVAGVSNLEDESSKAIGEERDFFEIELTEKDKEKIENLKKAEYMDMDSRNPKLQGSKNTPIFILSASQGRTLVKNIIEMGGELNGDEWSSYNKTKAQKLIYTEGDKITNRHRINEITLQDISYWLKFSLVETFSAEGQGFKARDTEDTIKTKFNAIMNDKRLLSILSGKSNVIEDMMNDGARVKILNMGGLSKSMSYFITEIITNYISSWVVANKVKYNIGDEDFKTQRQYMVVLEEAAEYWQREKGNLEGKDNTTRENTSNIFLSILNLGRFAGLYLGMISQQFQDFPKGCFSKIDNAFSVRQSDLDDNVEFYKQGSANVERQDYELRMINAQLDIGYAIYIHKGLQKNDAQKFIKMKFSNIGLIS